MELVQHVADKVWGEGDNFAWELTHYWLKTFEKILMVKVIKHLDVDLENILEVSFSAVEGWFLTE